jgi:hypothetical protein
MRLTGRANETTRLMLETLEIAYYHGKPVHEEAAAYLVGTMKGLRNIRAMQRRRRGLAGQEMLERSARSILRSRRLMRELMKRYASFRGEHPAACVPVKHWAGSS